MHADVAGMGAGVIPLMRLTPSQSGAPPTPPVLLLLDCVPALGYSMLHAKKADVALVRNTSPIVVLRMGLLEASGTTAEGGRAGFAEITTQHSVNRLA